MPVSNAHTLPALADLTDERIAEAARAAGEPEWLVARRVAAWQHFAASEPPMWRRTDLTKFKPALIAPPAGVQGTAVQAEPDLAPLGVIFTTLKAALRDHAELIERLLGTAVDPLTHKFSALHAALWQDGVFLYVPKNVAVELPLRAIFTLSEGGNASFPHNLIVLERGASATFVEEYSSHDREDQALAAPATELIIGEGASLRFVSVQTWGKGVYHLGSQIARIERDGNLEWVAFNTGAQTQHIESETYLGGTGSRVEWKAATLATANQSLLTAPWLRHVGENTEGHMDFKTVVNAQGYSTFDGMIKIEKGSKATISRLEEHALHLSPNARSDSVPGLMIDTNDVQRAGHASTSGQVDEEQLFYMLSRGIKRADAVHMIVMGFFEPVLDRIPVDDLRERLVGIIESKI